MRFHICLAITAIFASAACDTQAPEENAASDAAPAGTKQRIRAMAEGPRNAVFIRAIRDAGQSCQHVDASNYIGRHQESDVWTAQCGTDGHWQVLVTDNAPATVISCAQAPLAGLPACPPDG